MQPSGFIANVFFYIYSGINKRSRHVPINNVTINIFSSYIIRYRQQIGDYCFDQVPMTYALATPYSKQKPKILVSIES